MYLSEDLDRTLKRYIGKFVSIFTFGGHRFVGRLESLLDGGFCLSNAERLDDYDESNWYSAMRDIERATQNQRGGRETIVLYPQVVCISCPDENLTPITTNLDSENDDQLQPDPLSGFTGDESQQIDLIMGRHLLEQLRQAGRSLLTSISDIRITLSEELGFSFPSIRISECSKIDVERCSMNWQGLKLAQMRFPIGYDLLLEDDMELSPGGSLTIKDPIWLAPANWVADAQSEQLIAKGLAVLPFYETFMAFIASTLRTYCNHFYTFEHTSRLMSGLRSSSPSLVEQTVERSSSLSGLHILLNQLVEDRCTIRPLNRILTEFGCRWETNEISDSNLSRCRLAISRWICNAFRDEADRIRIIQLPAGTENRLAHEKIGSELLQLIKQLRVVHRIADRSGPSCLMVEPANHRLIIKKLAWLMPNLTVVSSDEIESAGAVTNSFSWPHDTVPVTSKKKSEAGIRMAKPRPK